MRMLVFGVGVVCIGGIAFGWTHNVHRAADTIAMLRPLLAVLLLVAACMTRSRRARIAFGGIGVFSLASALVFLLPQAPGSDLRLYTKNVWFGNGQVAAVQADITEAAVDVVMLQELSGKTSLLVAGLKADFPHQHVCRFSGWSAMAVLSKHPFVSPPRCTNTRALVAAQIDKDGRSVWVVSAHIPWPWPFDNAAAETDAETLLRSLTGPIVVAGDFNAFPWSPRVQRIRAITQTQVAGPTRPTLTFRRVPLPLDHVLAPGGGAVSYRPFLGADHRGVVADIFF